MTSTDHDQVLLETAANWLRRIQAGELGPEGQRTFRAWLAAAPRHAAAMDLVTRAWTASGAIDDKGALRPDLTRARGLRLADGQTRPHRSSRPIAWMPPVGGLAAVLALALVWLWNGAVSEADYVTATHDHPQVTLSDGTVMRLGGSTHLRVRIDPLGRRVDLVQGEAEFQVAHERLRPFHVMAGALEVRDLGTRFTVSSHGGQVRAVLLEGAAEIRDRDSGRVLASLAPGQQVDQDGRGPLRLGKANVDQVKARQDGRMLFDDVPLVQVVPEVAARTGIVLHLDDPALGAIRVSGSYRADDVAGFLAALARLHPITWRQDANGDYRIARRR
ncbi:FecR family protein [Nitrospirillum sp. BR 11163]|uniref:FecR family protein n=1 Tax=Nitrospirillum sp. BR 11163 TaxID=3104323 RepID=UPI002AFEBCA0|nr:FecR domain-containing protein [Nitrospirillum sp. BR 11163]MEA1673109.1 FecR domain-containing protein [Nitrospirillum sp. BR 11163]